MPLSFPGGGTSSPTPKATNATSGTVKTDVLNADPIVYLQGSVDNLVSTAIATREPEITMLPVAKGGTGSGTVPTNGQLLIGNGAGYSLASLTAGSNIIITPGAGSISIASIGGGGASQTRETVTYTSPVLAPQGKLDFDAALGKRHDVLSIKTNVPAWVRTYPNAAYRFNDTNRSILDQPSNDFVASVDVVTQSSELEVLLIRDVPCSSKETVPSSTIKCTVVNLNSVSSAVIIEFVVVKKEA